MIIYDSVPQFNYLNEDLSSIICTLWPYILRTSLAIHASSEFHAHTWFAGTSSPLLRQELSSPKALFPRNDRHTAGAVLAIASLLRNRNDRHSAGAVLPITSLLKDRNDHRSVTLSIYMGYAFRGASDDRCCPPINLSYQPTIRLVKMAVDRKYRIAIAHRSSQSILFSRICALTELCLLHLESQILQEWCTAITARIVHISEQWLRLCHWAPFLRKISFSEAPE